MKFKDLTIRPLERSDIAKANKFRDFINELVDDRTALIGTGERKTIAQEKEWLENLRKRIKERKQVFLFVEDKGKIVCSSQIEMKSERQSHVGVFGISVLKDHRGIGLGACMMKEILKAAEEGIKPRPKIIRLSANADNKIAISLYKKMGFKIVAKIPKQLYFHKKFYDEIIMLLEL